VKLVVEVYLEQNLKIPFISASDTSASRANGNGLKDRDSIPGGRRIFQRKFVVLTAVTSKIIVFNCVRSRKMFTDVSKEYVASVFKEQKES
jgi:hypothetical protein